GRELSRSQARVFPLADVADQVVHPSIPRRGGLTGLDGARRSYRVVEGLPGVTGSARIRVAVRILVDPVCRARVVPLAFVLVCEERVVRRATPNLAAQTFARGLTEGRRIAPIDADDRQRSVGARRPTDGGGKAIVPF